MSISIHYPNSKKPDHKVIIRCPHLPVTKFHIQSSVEVLLGNKHSIVPTSANNTSKTMPTQGWWLPKLVGIKSGTEHIAFGPSLSIGSMLPQISI